MFILYIIASAILGAIIGSFLNVCAYRYGTGMSIATGRSRCMCCGKTLTAVELVPIVSFLFQGARCRNCRSKISWQYPLVELLAAVLFSLVFIRQWSLYPLYIMYPHGPLYLVLLTVFYWSVASILIIIGVYDIRHKIIPQGLVYTFIILSVIKLIAFAILFGSLSIFDLLAPIILFVPFWFLWFVSKGTWIGLGDGKLAFGIGALLGLSFGLSSIILGFWIGALCCIVLICIEYVMPGIYGGIKRGTEIPLGPFLILGALIVLFWHVDVLGLSHFLTL